LKPPVCASAFSLTLPSFLALLFTLPLG
jgi:hypothetical protein